MAARDATLRIEDVRVEHRDAGGNRLAALVIDRLDVASGEMVGISGPSGAGKTTLLDVLAGILVPTTGRVAWGGEDIAAFAEFARDRWRRGNLGFVFQDFHLVPELSVRANILLPLTFDRFRVDRAARRRADDLAGRIGLADAGRAVSVLSRGEQQRVAIARALIRAPRILIADEPTASLDAATGEAVADLLLASARELGATLVVVSHDARLLERLPRRIALAGGRIAEDRRA